MNTNNPLPSAITHEVDYLVALDESLKDDPMKSLSEANRARTDGYLLPVHGIRQKNGIKGLRT